MPDSRNPLAKCPICGRDAVTEVRPFCSKRCADVDLGRWFSGQYRTPSLRIDPEDDEGDRPLDPGPNVG